jgi:hypothetical protein
MGLEKFGNRDEPRGTARFFILAHRCHEELSEKSHILPWKITDLSMRSQLLRPSCLSFNQARAEESRGCWR